MISQLLNLEAPPPRGQGSRAQYLYVSSALFRVIRNAVSNQFGPSAELRGLGLSVSDSDKVSYLTDALRILTDTLPIRNMRFDQCLCGSLPTLPIPPPQGGNGA